MKLIGLTGGIGAGKSTVAARLAAHGAVIIDADQVAREVVEPGKPAFDAIVATFGTSVLTADGGLNRAALGAQVFSDPKLLATLNAITHPRIREEVTGRIAAAPVDAIVVYDVPLLVEAAVDHPFDCIVVVEASSAHRIRRLVERRGMTIQAAEQRIQSQADDAARHAVADYVINTDGTLEETLRQADAFWATLRSA